MILEHSPQWASPPSLHGAQRKNPPESNCPLDDGSDDSGERYALSDTTGPAQPCSPFLETNSGAHSALFRLCDARQLAALQMSTVFHGAFPGRGRFHIVDVHYTMNTPAIHGIKGLIDHRRHSSIVVRATLTDHLPGLCRDNWIICFRVLRRTSVRAVVQCSTTD